MSAFNIRTGGDIISKVMGMLGVGGSLLFERSFSNHSLKTSEIIHSVYDEMIYEVLVDEISTTVYEKHKYTFDDTMVTEMKVNLN